MIINVTENDIVKAMNNPKHNPVQIAVSRTLNVDIKDVDYEGGDRIVVWYEDEIDHITYIVEDENLDRFMEEWDFFLEECVDFAEEPFSFSAEERKFQSFS